MGNANTPHAQAQGNKALIFAKRTGEHHRFVATATKSTLGQLPVGPDAQINGASDAQVNGASDAHERRNGASDAQVNGSSATGPNTPDGASDAQSHGASDAQAIDAQLSESGPFNDTHHGASDALESTIEGNTIPPVTQPAEGIQVGPTGPAGPLGTGDASRSSLQGQRGRRARRGPGSRRRIFPPQTPRNASARSLIDMIIASLPYLSTLNNRQIGTHTWSNQLVPLIWCATQDDTYEQLREALIAAERGYSALTAFRAWWIGQGIHTAENAKHTLDAIARQVGVRGPPTRQYQYLAGTDTGTHRCPQRGRPISRKRPRSHTTN